MRPVVAALLAIAACDDDLAPDPGLARSGRRLELYRYVYEDGTAQIEHAWFHDALRDERCAPRRWSDGVTYCTPEAGEAIYTSGACTELVGRVGVGAAAPRYFLRNYWLEERWVPSRLYEAGAPVAAPPQLWELRDGACLGPYPAGSGTYRALVAEVDRAALVRIRTTEIASSSRLALSAYTSADGLHAPVAVRDRELDTPCSIEARAGATSTACVPDDAAAVGYFHDPACSQPELAVSRGSTRPPRVSHRELETGCTTYHAIGERVDAPPLFERAGARCVPATTLFDERFYLAGPPLDLPALTRVTTDAGDRLRPIEVTDGAFHLRDSLLHDTRLATECRRMELGDELRCVPATTTEVAFVYGDAACATLLEVAMVREGPCIPDVAYALAPSAEGPVVRAVGAPRGGPLFHLSTGERCLPYVVPAGLVPHDVGPPLPTSAFAGAELRIDRTR